VLQRGAVQQKGAVMQRGAALLRPVALAGALALGITWQALPMTPLVAISPVSLTAALSAEADPHPLPGRSSVLGELDDATSPVPDDSARAGPCDIEGTGERPCTGVEERVRAGTDVAGLTAGTLALVTSGFWVLRRRREHRDLHPSGSRGTGERGVRERGPIERDGAGDLSR